jgi:branched-subunit amino acid ABC-type transport system permease component
MTALWQYILSGLSGGCTYALVALALVIVANVTGVFNFATGDYIMLGGMITAVTEGAGWAIWLSVLASVAAVTGFAILQERLTLAPVRGKVGPLGLVIATLGVGVALRGAVLLIWGQNARAANPFQANFHLFGAALQNQVKWVFLTTVLLLLAVNFLFARTDFGRAMRASAINPIAARLTGMRIGTTSLMAFSDPLCRWQERKVFAIIPQPTACLAMRSRRAMHVAMFQAPLQPPEKTPRQVFDWAVEQAIAADRQASRSTGLGR